MTNTIVVLTSGFVFVGECSPPKNGWLEVTNTYNIRQYGTTKGLGQLAVEGIQPSTVLDQVGVLRAPISSVVCLIEAPKIKL